MNGLDPNFGTVKGKQVRGNAHRSARFFLAGRKKLRKKWRSGSRRTSERVKRETTFTAAKVASYPLSEECDSVLTA